MRDGERFFAEGRGNVNFDLVQQQMRRAGAWRIGMRRAVLQQLANLGRDDQIFQQAVELGGRRYFGTHFRVSDGAAVYSYGGFGGGGLDGRYSGAVSRLPQDRASPVDSELDSYSVVNGPVVGLAWRLTRMASTRAFSRTVGSSL
jgi:hypothetical protein